MLQIAVVFFTSLLIATFAKKVWLSLALYLVGLAIILGMVFIGVWNNGKIDLTAVFLLLGAWQWGKVGGILLRLMWARPAQVILQNPNQLLWLSWLESAFFLALAAGWIGYAFASNLAISYAKNMEAAWMLYERSMAGAAGGFFWLSLAAVNALTAFVKPALTNKGLRVGIAGIVEWKEFNSYDWQGNKLFLRRKTKLFNRWSNDSQFGVNPAQQEAVNQLLTQHLPDKQVQSPTSVQATS
jgi:hypothetical protein